MRWTRSASPIPTESCRWNWRTMAEGRRPPADLVLLEPRNPQSDHEFHSAVERAAGSLGVVGRRLVGAPAGGAQRVRIQPRRRLRAGGPADRLAGPLQGKRQGVLLVGGGMAQHL